MSEPKASRDFPIEYDPRFVEAAVLLRLDGDPEEKRFRRARDLIYELQDVEVREGRFHEFHAEWFLQFQLGQPIREALAEQPIVVQQTRRRVVLPAPSAREEKADLYELLNNPKDAVPEKALLLQLKPQRLLDAAQLRIWLRHELMHVADMLDPCFGYERVAPAELGPAYANLLRDRYRVLWDTWIDGRLTRRGALPEDAREKRLKEFIATFPGLGQQAEARFQEIFDSDSQTHAGLMCFARNPETELSQAHEIAGGRICPLCRFPTFRLMDIAAGLPPDVKKGIAEDFPDWRPEQGLCCQCADLYQARNLSRAAEAMLPRV